MEKQLVRGITLLAVFMTVASHNFAQITPGHPRALCSFNCSNNFNDLAKCESKETIASFTSSTPDHMSPYQIFDDLVMTIKDLPKNNYDMSFRFAQCDVVCSAAAANDAQGKQIVYYNATYLDKFKNDQVGQKWIIYSIFAHEIGHQLMGHTKMDYTTLSARERRVNEIRADFFSAFVLAHIPGCTLDNAMAGINSLDKNTYLPATDADEEKAYYPTLEHRKEAIIDGFKKDPADTTTIEIFKNITQYAIDRQDGTILDVKLDRDAFAGKLDQTLKFLDDYYRDHPDVDKATIANMKGIVLSLQKKPDEANQNFKKAIRNDKVNLDYYKNSIIVEPDEDKKKKTEEKLKKLQQQQLQVN
jgi:tetratricopeptide (TPR) repeat protein